MQYPKKVVKLEYYPSVPLQGAIAVRSYKNFDVYKVSVMSSWFFADYKRLFKQTNKKSEVSPTPSCVLLCELRIQSCKGLLQWKSTHLLWNKILTSIFQTECDYGMQIMNVYGCSGMKIFMGWKDARWGVSSIGGIQMFMSVMAWKFWWVENFVIWRWVFHRWCVDSTGVVYRVKKTKVLRFVLNK